MLPAIYCSLLKPHFQRASHHRAAFALRVIEAAPIPFPLCPAGSGSTNEGGAGCKLHEEFISTVFLDAIEAGSSSVSLYAHH